MGSVLRIWHEYRMAGAENLNENALKIENENGGLSEQPSVSEAQAALPSYDELRELAEITSINDFIIDEANATVFLRQHGLSLDVGSVAKGYAAGLAAETAREAGLTSGIINIGGHVITIGRPLGGARDYWSIGIQNPEIGGALGDTVDAVYMNDMTLSISGGYLRLLVVDGVAYNHIIDPETLFPANRYKQVAVIHENSALADIISTALFILPIEQGKELAQNHGAKVLWIDIDGQWTANEGYIDISRNMRE
jgi:thiamine biosynthesis lipoprotein